MPPTVDLIRQSAELVEVPKLRFSIRAVGEIPSPLSEIFGRALVTPRSEIDPRQ
jgi:hypothetical protein